MKNTVLLSTIVFVIGISVSCSKEINRPSQEPVAEASITCFPNSVTKTSLGTEQSGIYPVIWSDNDKVEVYSQDGLIHSTYTLYSKQESGAGIFRSSIPVAGTGRTAVYPASSFLGYTDDGSIRVDMGSLSNQQYSSQLSDGNTDVSCYPLWALEDAENEGSFQFNNLCGCLSLQLNDYQGLGLQISSVEIKSASRSLTGVARINPIDGTIQIEDAETKSGIKVTSESGQSICGSTPSLNATTECFLIAIPAGEYPGGDLTFSITDSQGRVFTKTVSSTVSIAPGVVKRMARLQMTLFYGSANCIIVEPGSNATVNAKPFYSFSSLYEYENNPVRTASGAEYLDSDAQVAVLWELAEGASAFADGSVLTECNYEDGVIHVTSGTHKGNALVALKDESGKILWSFHIWVTDAPQDYSYTNIEGGVFMDRNLGATSLDRCSKSPASLDVMGLYYQHGRKDPFAASLSSWNTVLSTSIQCSQTEGTIAYSIQHPDVRVINNAAKYHWNTYGDCLSFWGSSKNLGSTNAAILAACANEPDSPKTVYDPCPAGYKVSEAKYLNFNLKDTAKATLTSTGVDIKYDGTNTTYWPFNGYLCHDSDAINTTGSRRGTVLCNWTTGANPGYSVRLFATSSAYTLTTSASQGRAIAAGVRCRKMVYPQGDPMIIDSQLEEPEDETIQ